MANIENKKEKVLGLTKKEKEMIAEKTGYAYSTVNMLLMCKLKKNKRNMKVIRIAKKMLYFKKLHQENLMKDLKNIQ